MSSRKAKAARPEELRTPVDLPVSARIAWSYLASVGALVIAGGTLVLGNASVGTAACRATSSDAAADCRLGWAVVSTLVGLALGWVLLGLLLQLGWRYALAATSVAALLVAVDRLETWWWWALAALIPLAAALASHDWGDGPRATRIRDIGLAVLGVAAVAALVWWLVA